MSSLAETLPECDTPRSTFGAPITTGNPSSRAVRAAGTVVGNSAMEPPRSRSASIASGESGS
jgi:hypothetical protein